MASRFHVISCSHLQSIKQPVDSACSVHSWEIGGNAVKEFARRTRFAAVALFTLTALGLSACSGTGQGSSDTAVNTVNAGLATSIDEAIAHALTLSGSDSAIVGLWGSNGAYLQAYGDGVNVSSPIRAAQASQPVMCALLLDLVDEGQLTLDRKVSEDLTRQVGLNDITYGQLCRATSGLADFKPRLSNIFINNPTRPWVDRELLAQGMAHSPLSWPGLDVHLSDTNAVLLGRALTSVTGTNLTELLHARVYGPAGMTSSSYPADPLVATALPSGAMPALTYPSSSGAPVCDAGVSEIPRVSPSMLQGAGATLTTVSDLKSFYERYLTGGFGGLTAEEITTSTSTDNPKRDEQGNPLPPAEDAVADPNAKLWAFGLEQVGPLYGMSGAMTGTLTASYHDPASGFTVVVALNNSSAGANFIRTLALQLAALASEAGNGPALDWKAEAQAATLTAAAICQPATETATDTATETAAG